MTSYVLAGNVAVRVDGDAAERLVAPWRSDATTAAKDDDLRVRDAEDAVAPLARTRDAFFGDIDVWAERDRHVLVAGRTAARVVDGTVEASGSAAPPPWLGLLALAIALRPRSIFHLHAGGVALDGRTLLVVGGSGAGKTTTTLALLAAAPRARSLGDDTVFLTADGGVLATQRPFHVTDATLALFPELRARQQGVVHEATRKHVVARPGNATGGAPAPRVCIFPSVGADAVTTVTPLSSADTLAQLIAQSAVLALPGVAGREAHLDVLARVADGATGIALRLGEDARRDPLFGARLALETLARCE